MATDMGLSPTDLPETRRSAGTAERVFVAANRWLIIGMMAAMVAMVFANVVSRYIWNYSFIWAEELSQYLMVWITFLGAGLALREGRHVAVELLQDRLPIKTKRSVRHLVAALIILFLLALVILGFQFAIFAWEQETPVMNIPLGIPYLAVPLGALLLLAHIGFIYRHFIDNQLEYPESLEAPVEEGEI
jgi:TRAP-type C4-dicarboxylate transport system permease small subunit